MADRPEDQTETPEDAAENPEPAEDGDRGGPKTAAERVIAQFGGIRPMANKLSVPVTTVQGWKTRSVIPETRHAEIRQAAETQGITLNEEDLREAAGLRDTDEAPGDPAPPTEAAAPDAPGADQPGTDDSGPAAEPAETTSRDADAETATVDEAPPRGPEPPAEEPALIMPPILPPGRSGRGLAWTAVLLAVVALIGAATAPAWAPSILPGIWSGPDDAPSPDRIAALEARLDALDAAPTTPGADGERVAALEQAVAEMEARLEAAAAAGGGDAGALAAALTERIDALETALARQPDAPSQPVAELAQALASLRAELQQVRDVAVATANVVTGLQEGPDVAQALDPLRSDLSGLRNRVETVDATLSSLSARVGTVVDTVGTVTRRVDQSAATTDQAIDDFGNRLSAIEDIAERVDRGLATDQALALAYSQLRNDLDGSGPFAISLETVRDIVGDDPALADALTSIEGRAGSGIPTRAALAARFPDLARTVLQSAGADPDPDWLDLTVESLSNLVTIRRAPGMVAGEEPDAVLARAEFNLQAGDLPGALQEMQALDGAAAEAAAGWVADAGARLAAETVLEQVGQTVLDRLSEATPSEAGQ